MPLDVYLPHAEGFRYSPGTVTVTDVAVQLLPSDSTRKGFILTNNGATSCYWGDRTVSAGNVASPTGGSLINEGGDYLSGSMTDGYCGEIWAICRAGQSTVVAVRSW